MSHVSVELNEIVDMSWKLDFPATRIGVHPTDDQVLYTMSYDKAIKVYSLPHAEDIDDFDKDNLPEFSVC